MTQTSDERRDRLAAAAHMLKELEQPTRELSSWELDFLDSLSGQLEQRGTLSDKQYAKLTEIYEAETDVVRTRSEDRR